MLKRLLYQVPNILTCGRFVLTVIFLVMLLWSPQQTGPRRWLYLDIAFVLFVIAGLTDMVDGTIARGLKVTSKFGRMVDPLADKALVCGAFICFAIIDQPTLFGFGETTLAIIQWGFAAVIILREVYVTVLRHLAEARGINFAATVSGKIKMFLQSFAIGTVMVKMAHVHDAQWGWWFTSLVYILTVLITVISGLRATQRTSWQQIKTP
ncbi:MAG: CDP-alcohol phosphatidyltransferase family protein [Phycisphaerae bacterium]|jgi:CDP-diacylglycerol--glycerol-3-phosphate 3-phosphatidyltransferase